ncbi:hypothetical protein [Microbacterium telephonicum]|uniref:Lipoprotein n=1 Tax=Microbacterium telephonicum TaxID=1714841 RepID=A0A498C9T3_9MICO|nr:hypothetical protein [Microbacterium telephonicum]RLK52472.1 hypothetical protein C7474_0410 [Microbacterium telephonicum]
MTRRSVTPVLALAASALLALGLAACAPEVAAPDASASPTRSPLPGSTPSPTPTPTPTSDAELLGPDCLVGDWTMDQAGLDQFYVGINAATAGSGIGLTPKGTATLMMGSDGTYAWAPSAEITAQAGGTAIVVTLGGSVDGTYTATDDRVTAATTSTDALQISATLDGSPTDASAVAEQISTAPVADAGYACTADTLTLTSTVAGGTATAVLHRG